MKNLLKTQYIVKKLSKKMQNIRAASGQCTYFNTALAGKATTFLKIVLSYFPDTNFCQWILVKFRKKDGLRDCKTKNSQIRSQVIRLHRPGEYCY